MNDYCALKSSGRSRCEVDLDLVNLGAKMKKKKENKIWNKVHKIYLLFGNRDRCCLGILAREAVSY